MDALRADVETLRAEARKLEDTVTRLKSTVTDLTRTIAARDARIRVCATARWCTTTRRA